MPTVIQSFDNAEQAQHAVERLVAGGFSRETIHLMHGAQGDGTVRSPAMEDEGAEPGDRSVLSSMGHFFVSALGADQPDDATGRHSAALQRGGSVLALNAGSQAEADKASALLRIAG